MEVGRVPGWDIRERTVDTSWDRGDRVGLTDDF
jgi:hypothetical protein